MTDHLDEWYRRKRSRQLVSIKEAHTSRFKHYACLGPRGQFAVVQLRGEPSTDFSFESRVTWPDPRCADCLMDGILDELFATGAAHTAGKVRFILDAIEWHDVDSSPRAFYHAARGAVREILAHGQSGNIDWNFDSEKKS